MKYCVFCVTASLAAVSYGWGLGDALKAVDKATEKINAVNQSLNGPSSGDVTGREKPANPSVSAVAYNESRRMTIFSECNAQLNAARARNEIDARTSYPVIQEWLRNEKSTIVNAESEQIYRTKFAEKLNDARAALSSGAPATGAVASPRPATTPIQQSASPQPVSAVAYDSQKKMAIKNECLQQLKQAEDAQQIGNAGMEIENWLMSNIQKVNNEETESEYRATFKQKLDAAKGGNSEYTEIRAIYEECKNIVSATGMEGEWNEFAMFFFGNTKGGGELRGFGHGKPGNPSADGADWPALTLASAKEYKEKLVKKQAEVAAAKEEESRQREYADSLRPLDRQLIGMIDSGIPYDCAEKRNLEEMVRSFFGQIDWQGLKNLPSKESVEALKDKIDKTIASFKAAGEKAEALRNSLNDDLQLAKRLGIMTDQEFNQKHSEMRKFEEEHTLVEFVNEVETYLQTLKAKIAPVAEKIEARNKRLENLRKVVHDNNEAELSKDGWKLAKDALAPATQNDLADLIRDWRDDDPDGVWYAAAHSITDQKVLEDMLVVNDNWIRNFNRDGIMVMTQEKVYYAMYKNITDQELLMKLLDIKEINFRSCDVDSYGHRDRAIFELLDNDHLSKLDKQRDARRKAVKGQTIDFKGFYLGMSRRDKELLLKTEAKGVEKVGGKYGVMGSGPMSDLWFGAEERLKYLGVKKDGLVGLAELVNKYVPGGIDSTGDVQVGGQVDAGYDPENPEVTVKTWWFVNVPQFKCRIRMYDSGSINIYTTDEYDKVELDFSKAGK